MRLAGPNPPPQADQVLRCAECRAVSAGDASYWIAILVPPEEPLRAADVAFYCPRCAETHFQFFSSHRRPRVTD